mgnify:CR=1 FL=1
MKGGAMRETGYEAVRCIARLINYKSSYENN